MLQPVRISLLAALFLSLTASRVAADSKHGPLTLQEGEAKAVRVNLGEKLQATCSFYLDTGKDGQALHCSAKINNPTDKLRYYGYFVAFFDKDNRLVVTQDFCSRSITKLEPGKSVRTPTWVYLPPAVLAKIASYQVALVESETPFAK